MRKNVAQSKVLLKLLGIFAILNLIFIFIQLVVIPSIRLQKKQHELIQVEREWLTHRPTTYQVEVYSQNFTENPPTCNFYGSYVITVNNGKVVKSNAPIECQAVYDQLTIENGFVLIEQYLKRANPFLATVPKLDYNITYNFVSYFYIAYTDSIFSTSFSPTFISYDYFRVLDGASNLELSKP